MPNQPLRKGKRGGFEGEVRGGLCLVNPSQPRQKKKNGVKKELSSQNIRVGGHLSVFRSLLCCLHSRYPGQVPFSLCLSCSIVRWSRRRLRNVSLEHQEMFALLEVFSSEGGSRHRGFITQQHSPSLASLPFLLDSTSLSYSWKLPAYNGAFLLTVVFVSSSKQTAKFPR